MGKIVTGEDKEFIKRELVRSDQIRSDQQLRASVLENQSSNPYNRIHHTVGVSTKMTKIEYDG